MTLFKVDNGRKCGGYSKYNWESESPDEDRKRFSGDFDVKDKKAFLFSLEVCNKYMVHMERDAITCNANKGPIFGKDSLAATR